MTQGLFTAGTSIEELLAKRNTRANALQQSLMANAAQGAARPMEAQAASLIGSSLGRALAGSMNGGQDAERAKIEAANAAQSQAQAGYLDAAAGKSAAMFAQVEALRTSHPAAAVKMLALAKQAKKEEDAVEAAQVKAVAAAEEATRVQEVEAKKIIDKKAEIERKEEVARVIRVEKRAQELFDKDVDKEEAKAQALKEEEKNAVTIWTGAEWNAGHDGSLSEGSIWKVWANGDMQQIDKPTKANVTNTLQAGYTYEYDDKGNPTKMVPIEGGKPYLDAQAAQVAAEAEEERKANADNTKEVYTDTVTTSLSDLSGIITKSMNQPIDTVTGTGGWAMSMLPMSSQRGNANAALDSAQGVIAVGNLQIMRDNSPTGGALGNITEKELKMLQGLLGTIDLDTMTPEKILEVITLVEGRYQKLVTKVQRGYTVNADGSETPYATPQAAAKTPEKKGFGTGAGPNTSTSSEADPLGLFN